MPFREPSGELRDDCPSPPKRERDGGWLGPAEFYAAVKAKYQQIGD